MPNSSVAILVPLRQSVNRLAFPFLRPDEQCGQAVKSSCLANAPIRWWRGCWAGPSMRFNCNGIPWGSLNVGRTVGRGRGRKTGCWAKCVTRKWRKNSAEACRVCGRIATSKPTFVSSKHRGDGRRQSCVYWAGSQMRMRPAKLGDSWHPSETSGSNWASLDAAPAKTIADLRARA